MKLILSRKGFDSSAGGVASPIFPDGAMSSLPIPARHARKTYGDVRNGLLPDRTDMGSLVEELTSGRIRRDAPAHLDPDINAGALPRRPGWRPCFGQTSAAQGHLQASGIGPGDIFLFFGWFRPVARQRGGTWRFEPRSPDLHAVFGWLQVGEIIRVDEVGVPRLLADRPWLEDHPHLHFGPDPRNVVHIAAERLVLPGIGDTGLPGAGVVDTFDRRLVLTAPASPRRGLWRLPHWFAPDRDGGALSYHADPRRWQPTREGVLLATVGRGQEFVLDCSARPDAGAWVAHLVGPCRDLQQAA